MPKPPSVVRSEQNQIADLRSRLKSLTGASTTLLPPYSKRFQRVRLGIGDDCAILQPPRGHEVVITTDFSLETVHFQRDWHTPESVGYRCLTRGLSDLAAMGGRPLAAFLSLALPDELVRSRLGHASWRDRFLTALLALAGKYGVPLAGGDTAQSPRNPLSSAIRTQKTGWALADIVLVGSAPRNRALLRSGARVGDRIYVTGHLGGAAAELALLAACPRRFRRCVVPTPGHPNPHPHLFPEPRLAVGAWLLRNRRATAAIDISDGLSTDLNHICRESGLAATVDAASIPIHPLAIKSHAQNSLKMALDGGEDYELLFTASPRMKIPDSIADVPVFCVGTLRRYDSRTPRVVLLVEKNGRKSARPMPPQGWQHFK